MELFHDGHLDGDEYKAYMSSVEAELRDVEQKMYAVSYGADKIDISRFLSGSVPIAFEKIHARFPHLTLNRIIEFEKALRTAGGSVMVHSGKFALTRRDLGSGIHFAYPMIDSSHTWTCCHSIHREDINCNQDWPDIIYHDVKVMSDSIVHNDMYFCNIDPSTKRVQRRVGITDDCDGHWDIDVPKDSPDLKNPNPIGQCDAPVLFSLTRDFTVRDDMTIAELKVAARTKFDELEFELSLMKNKANALTELIRVLDVLSDP